MERYCIYTRLVDNPNVRLYYKGQEDCNNVANVRNVVVGFLPEDSLSMNRETAKELCSFLNEDLDILHLHGFMRFKTTLIFRAKKKA